MRVGIACPLGATLHEVATTNRRAHEQSSDSIATTADEGGLRDADATTVLFRPVRPGNTFEDTVERLLSAVKLGLVAVGERLPPERDLAARLEVSRMTLREAIRALQQAGYVESRRGRQGGTFVTAHLPEQGDDELRPESNLAALADAITFRELVETGAAALAARRRLDTPEVAHVRQRLDECDAATDDGGARYRRADSRLHLAIAEATGSPSVVAAVADARMAINHLLDTIPLLHTNLVHSNEQHHLLVEAVLAHDENGARAAMADHVSGSAALLRAFLG